MKNGKSYFSRKGNSMSKLSLLDLAFLHRQNRSQSQSMFAGLLIAKRPVKSTPAFAKNLHKEFHTFTEVMPPFNRVINFSAGVMPQW